jgi:type II secretory ATPase GspE/PulE/Tfp pilus assembly ATPase PilB-like protein
MCVGFALFFFLPGFLISFAVLMVVLLAEVATYLILRNQKVGLGDLKEQFHNWLNSFKSKEKVAKEVPNQVTVLGKGGVAMEVPKGEDPNRPAFDAIQAALTEPLRKGAEMIMLSPSENGVAVKYQVDGMDYKGTLLERANGAAAVTLLKSTAGLDVNDRRKPQKAMVKLVIEGKRREYRIETAGSTAGEAARFLLDPKKRHDFKADTLGFNARQAEVVRKLLKEERSGIIIVAAPRTMGMTSTLYGLMRGHDAFLEHLQTVERDPEGEMEGITQNKLTANAGPAEEQKAISWAISQEPDALMVSRLEDPKAAVELVHFAKEKRVYIGMRAGSAFEALTQWRKLVGNDKAAVESLKLIIAGRVVRKLCMACKVSYAPDPGVVKKLGLNPEKASTLYQARTQPLRDPKGNPVVCQFCTDLRYKGRTGVFEMLVVDDDIRAVVAANGSDSHLKAAFRKQRGRYLQEEALGLVESGDTSVQEVLRVLKIGTGGGGSTSDAAPAAAPTAPAPQRSPARSAK